MGDEGPKVTRPDSGVGDVAQYYSMHEYGYDYGTVWYGLVWYGYGIIMDMAMDMVGLVVHDACHGRLQYVNSGEIRGKKRQESRKVGSEA